MDTNDILKVVILGLLIFLTIEISYFYTEATFRQDTNNDNSMNFSGLISEVFNGIGYIMNDVKAGIDNFFEELSIQSSNR